MQSPENPDEGNRRQLLIRCAGRLFREKGFDATTIRDIADAAGMRSGSPFYHFRSKQDLLATVMVAGLESACLAIERVQAEGAKDDERLFRRMVAAHLSTILAPDSDFAVLLSEWRSLPPDARASVVAVKNRYEALWTPVLDRLASDGRLGGPSGLRRLFVLGTLNWAIQWYRQSGRLSIEEIAEAAATFMLRPDGAVQSANAA